MIIRNSRTVINLDTIEMPSEREIHKSLIFQLWGNTFNYTAKIDIDSQPNRVGDGFRLATIRYETQGVFGFGVCTGFRRGRDRPLAPKRSTQGLFSMPSKP